MSTLGFLDTMGTKLAFRGRAVLRGDNYHQFERSKLPRGMPRSCFCKLTSVFMWEDFIDFFNVNVTLKRTPTLKSCINTEVTLKHL